MAVSTNVFNMLISAKVRGANSIRRLGNSLQGVQGKAKNLALSFKGMAGPLAAIAGITAATGGASLISGIFGTTAQLQSQTRSLQVLTGSAEKTNQILKELQAFGAATPFQVNELIEITKKLKAFGIETESLVGTTKRLADVAGATGAELDGIATAFGQIRAKGKLQQEENLQLLERGVDLTSELRKMYNLSGEELAKAMTKGQISFEAANLALVRLTSSGGKYFGGASAQADTLNGKLSTLQDAFITLGQNIGKALEPIFKGIIDFLTDLTNRINEIFRRQRAEAQAAKELGIRIGAAGTFRGPEGRERRRQLRARTEELMAEGFGVIETKPSMKVPSLLAATEKEKKGAKETKQISNELLAINKRIADAKIVGNQFTLAGLEHEKAIQLIKDQGLKGANKANALLEANSALNERRMQLLSGTEAKQDKLNDKTKKMNQLYEQIADTLAGSFTDALMGLIDGTKSLTESLSGLFRQLASMFLQTGFSGFFKSILPIKSAKGNVFAQNGIVPYARGGLINRPTLSLMGEAGPEAVLPLRRGAGGRLGVETSGGMGMGSIVVNVDAQGTQVEGDQPNANRLGEALGAAVRAELLRQKRPGGLLS